MSKFGFDEEEEIVSAEELKKKELEIRDFFNELAANNKLKCVPAQVRNVVFVGRARGGKTTAFSMLCNPSHVAGPMSIFRGTVSPQMHTFCMRNSQGVNININIIDTPGLFEVTEKTEQHRENQRLVEVIQHCVDSSVVKLHAIFFVCSFLEGVNFEDVASMLTFSELFRGAAAHISLLVTHAELLGPEGMARVEKEVQTCTALLPLINMIRDPEGNPRIFFSGCLPRDAVDDIDSMRARSRTVNAMRKRLFQFICDIPEDSAFDLRTLPACEVEAQLAKRWLLELKQTLESGEFDKLEEPLNKVLSKRLFLGAKDQLAADKLTLKARAILDTIALDAALQGEPSEEMDQIVRGLHARLTVALGSLLNTPFEPRARAALAKVATFQSS